MIVCLGTSCPIMADGVVPCSEICNEMCHRSCKSKPSLEASFVLITFMDPLHEGWVGFNDSPQDAESIVAGDEGDGIRR